MSFSLSSSLRGSTPFLRRQNSAKRRRSPITIAVSGRATKTNTECRENDYCQTSKSNFYEVLSLSPNNASLEQVKRAYRTKARRYHPDACSDPSMKAEATRIFVQLHAAYKTLSDPVLRENYDCQLRFSSTTSDLDQENCKRKRWQDQIVELKKRSSDRTAEKHGSWGSRMRARNIYCN
ncbi:chaperone protein dnaJ 20, chloroplastic-like [Melia azedarach]|uniref:Chaperone protein dnaJ 20, chloroplastic-like n=1 Tax=Melia azedarach TaxID=155640 RepID=A0ACC1Y0K5_MELAZ|nr:chaperone protein dnaJ 20, chloroplastic-like [Melia azedarach]